MLSKMCRKSKSTLFPASVYLPLQKISGVLYLFLFIDTESTYRYRINTDIYRFYNFTVFLLLGYFYFSVWVYS